MTKDKLPVLVLVRGASGAGKSTFADLLSDDVESADKYLMEDGVYKWAAHKLNWAHTCCEEAVKRKMIDRVDRIVVANTFTKARELKAYQALAKEFNYRIFTVIVENRHGSKNVHDVPEEMVEKQKARFNIEL